MFHVSCDSRFSLSQRAAGNTCCSLLQKDTANTDAQTICILVGFCSLSLTWHVRTSPTEYIKVYERFGTYELLHQDPALIWCSAEDLAFTLQTEGMAVVIKTEQVKSSRAVLTLRKLKERKET